MAYEVITLNLIPSGEVPVIHAAQYDVDRPLRFALKLGDDDFDPRGYDLEIQIRKVDNNVVTDAPASVSGNVVTFNSTEQMTACSGTNLGEIQITKDDLDIATLHFYLVVQRDVLAGGVTSESAIHNITSQIADIVPQVIGDDYYDKDEVDALIAEHTFDPTNYYNKEEVDEKIAEIPTFDPTNYYDKSATDALLAAKADVSDLPDMTNYYDKTATDALLAAKADVSDLPDMSNYYNKTEVDNKITELYEIKTVSGSIAHITDGGDNIPLKSFESEIVAVQSGSGTPSPSNPRAISGFANGVVSVCGANLWSLGYVTGTRNTEIPFELKAGSYIISFEVTSTDTDSNTSSIVFIYDDNSLSTANQFTRNSRVSLAFTTDKKITSIRFYASDTYAHSTGDTFAFNNIQIAVGSTDTQYHAYNGNTYTFAFGQTVYGGHFDNKGSGESELALWTLGTKTNFLYDGSNKYVIYQPTGIKTVTGANDDCLCEVLQFKNSLGDYLGYYHIANSIVVMVPQSYTITDFNNEIAGTNLVYPLATPTTLSIASQDVPTLLGENNIFSNTGDCEVDYFTEKSNGIAELIKAFM